MASAHLRVEPSGLFTWTAPGGSLEAFFCVAFVDCKSGRTYWRRHRTDSLFGGPVLSSAGFADVDPGQAPSALREQLAEVAAVDAETVALVFVEKLENCLEVRRG